VPVFKSIYKYFRIARIRISARHLRHREITIIANNCTGAFIYQDLNLRYLSPTIWLYIHTPDYICFLQRLDEHLAMDLRFVSESRYEGVTPYPVGLLGEVEIHFLHYRDPDHARASWEARKQRIRRDRFFVLGSETMGCTVEHIAAFDALPFENKLFFTQNPYPQYSSTVHLKKYQNCDFSEYMRWRDWVEYIDVVKWLNGESDFRLQ
jgi:uncharacterized protein (DUF1919 family)